MKEVLSRVMPKKHQCLRKKKEWSSTYLTMASIIQRKIRSELSLIVQRDSKENLWTITYSVDPTSPTIWRAYYAGSEDNLSIHSSVRWVEILHPKTPHITHQYIFDGYGSVGWRDFALTLALVTSGFDDKRTWRRQYSMLRKIVAWLGTFANMLI